MRKIIGAEPSAGAVSAMASAPASAAPQDQVMGSGQVDSGGTHGQTIVDGHGTPTDAHGHMKIQIPDRDECARAFAAMIRRGRVDCYQDNTFIVPEPAVQLLQDM